MHETLQKVSLVSRYAGYKGAQKHVHSSAQQSCPASLLWNDCKSTRYEATWRSLYQKGRNTAFCDFPAEAYGWFHPRGAWFEVDQPKNCSRSPLSNGAHQKNYRRINKAMCSVFLEVLVTKLLQSISFSCHTTFWLSVFLHETRFYAEESFRNFFLVVVMSRSGINASQVHRHPGEVDEI